MAHSGVRACRCKGPRIIAQENERRKSVGREAWVDLSYPALKLRVLRRGETSGVRTRLGKIGHVFPAIDSLTAYPAAPIGQRIRRGLSVCSRPLFLVVKFAEWRSNGVSVSSTTPPSLLQGRSLRRHSVAHPRMEVKRFRPMMTLRMSMDRALDFGLSRTFIQTTSVIVGRVLAESVCG